MKLYFYAFKILNFVFGILKGYTDTSETHLLTENVFFMS